MLKINGTYCRVGVPQASNMNFEYAYIPLVFSHKNISGSVVTGTRRMKRMLQMMTDELETYEGDPEKWNCKIVNFDQVNEAMDNLQKGRNNSNWRYVLKW